MFCSRKLWRVSVLAAAQLFFVLSIANGSCNNLAKAAEKADKSVQKNIVSYSTSDSTSKIVLKKNDKGTKVLDIQKRLDVLGYNLPLTGYYGDATYNAVMDYQKKNSLKPTGSIDEALYKKLLNIPLLSLGSDKLKSTSQDVKDSSSMENFINKINMQAIQSI
jgi:peptidoglycan hydrolase-like protein with peptidoglycan-binding domain